MAENVKLGQAEKTRMPLSGQKEFIIDIEPDGSVIVDGFNMAGECHELIDHIVASLGEIEYTEDKEDFNKKQPIVTKGKTGVTINE